MEEITLTITNKVGLHARPASLFVQEASKYQSEITVSKGEESGDAKSILDLLTLGMAGLHPIQPAAMDIGEVKAKYGGRVCLLGNIDLDYTLTQGTPEEVDREVKERIAVAGGGGGYIITSANSLPNYCKTENVWAMSRAIRKYGTYPLDPHLR